MGSMLTNPLATWQIVYLTIWEAAEYLRVSPRRKLRGTDIDPNQGILLDVELWVYGSDLDNRQRMYLYKRMKYLANNHARVIIRANELITPPKNNQCFFPRLWIE